MIRYFIDAKTLLRTFPRVDSFVQFYREKRVEYRANQIRVIIYDFIFHEWISILYDTFPQAFTFNDYILNHIVNTSLIQQFIAFTTFEKDLFALVSSKVSFQNLDWLDNFNSHYELNKFVLDPTLWNTIEKFNENNPTKPANKILSGNDALFISCTQQYLRRFSNTFHETPECYLVTPDPIVQHYIQNTCNLKSVNLLP